MSRDFSAIRSHRFRDRRYRIQWKLPRCMTNCESCGQRTEPRKSDGQCDAPQSAGKVILIAPKLPEADLLETAIHESLHACLWDLEESAVSETARDTARLLRRMGFRLDQ